jgi:hypothetical protein
MPVGIIHSVPWMRSSVLQGQSTGHARIALRGVITAETQRAQREILENCWFSVYFYPKSCKCWTQRRGKGNLLSKLKAEVINLRSHPFREQNYDKKTQNGPRSIWENPLRIH